MTMCMKFLSYFKPKKFIFIFPKNVPTHPLHCLAESYFNEINLQDRPAQDLAALIHHFDREFFSEVSHKGWVQYLTDRNIGVQNTGIYQYVKYYEDIKTWTRHTVSIIEDDKPRKQAVNYFCKVIQLLVKEYDDINGAHAMYSSLKDYINIEELPKKFVKKFKKVQIILEKKLEKYQRTNNEDSIPYMGISLKDLDIIEELYHNKDDLEVQMERGITSVIRHYMGNWPNRKLEYDTT